MSAGAAVAMAAAGRLASAVAPKRGRGRKRVGGRPSDSTESRVAKCAVCKEAGDQEQQVTSSGGESRDLTMLFCDRHDCDAAAHVSCAGLAGLYGTSGALWYCGSCVVRYGRAPAVLDCGAEKLEMMGLKPSVRLAHQLRWFDHTLEILPKTARYLDQATNQTLALMNRPAKQRYNLNLVECVQMPHTYPIVPLRGQLGLKAVSDLVCGDVVSIYEGRVLRHDSLKADQIPQNSTKVMYLQPGRNEKGEPCGPAYAINASKEYGNGVAENINDFRVDVANLRSPANRLRTANVKFCGFWYGSEKRRVPEIADWPTCPATHAPEFGRYGAVSVRYGKAMRGSPPRRRTVLTTMGWAAEALAEWVEQIRRDYGPVGPALWPTERGARSRPITSTYGAPPTETLSVCLSNWARIVCAIPISPTF